MTYAHIIVGRDGPIATITLNRADAMNALTPEMLGEVDAALSDIAADPNINVLIMTGAGRAFCAGVDLKALQARGVDLSQGNVGDELNNAARGVIEKIESMPQATIAKVNGFTFTGGLELMLAFDIIIAAEEAKMGDTHAVLGFRPTWGLTQRLPRKVGSMRAKELSFTARTISGVEAAKIGLALEAVPLADLDARVAALAAAIARNSPGSIAAYKDLYAQANNAGQTKGLTYERDTAYDIADVGQRLGDFMAKLGGKG
ncbi:MAG: enoyl-CoA hydratase/isomerase family protein [Rhodospirillaceae bacterium]|jgi:enoyl-CoA hydratase|nr:enoyl-CoA hydratase/isomerase family protein [Rhodospirillaceae bacterium]MBT5082568.1 enoyl-CoA hydratase/isomerase family protein [Rhodospirillaceae bacterium]MBT5526102.1 enoyl-CoA hydratase/isomerase family protein [Rhodospirillaceae bacterium]MBT5879631.1 enoyl-CoA hydratase/isomerase family protein [Rhodospirillaceae bacterium]MBT6589206.1 enoyl-CoA hydratase/isomerase family protein [Rhodospirillaceae bacterium]